jgi:ADP-ribosylglycohydrolase
MFRQDRVRGVVFGQAVGDALGLGTEFLSKYEVNETYPGGLCDYGQIVRDEHRRRWLPGAWTDDTDQMLCILDSLLDLKRVDAGDIAARLLSWHQAGGMGIGNTVMAVLNRPEYLSDPHGAAAAVWRDAGCDLAANGAVMRTAILGAWGWRDHARVKANAEAVCRITHYDPRCVASCVAVCLAISRLLAGETDMPSLLEQLEQDVMPYDARVYTYLALVRHPDVAALELDEPEAIGYTLKAMGAGLWALNHANDFRTGLLNVIHEGGDADTNGAVAGALLGARFGFSAIPRPWIDGLGGRDDLEDRVVRLLEII